MVVLAGGTRRTNGSRSITPWLFRGLLLLLIGIMWSLQLTLTPPATPDDSPLLQMQSERKAVEEHLPPAPGSPAAVATTTSSANSIPVAYVTTITSCDVSLKNTIPFQITEAAAVLAFSIAKVHATTKNRYHPTLYAVHHPDAIACAAPLEALGYTLLARDTPVRVEDIQGDILRERIQKNGCCGERELIKLEAWTLVQYPVVVLLDLDVLIRKPLDGLFDFLLDSSKVPPKDDLLWRGEKETVIPETINLLYTVDYAMVSASRQVKPTQGGFVVLRPSMEIYQEFVGIVTEGDFRDRGGWHGKTGKFWGAMTFQVRCGWVTWRVERHDLDLLTLCFSSLLLHQGLMPLYFQILHPNTSVELNWCVWDNMCSPSREDGKGKCLTQQEDCEDCRNRPIDEVKLLHFTVCQKPWTCNLWPNNNIRSNLCRAFHHAWFLERAELERSWGRSGRGSGTWNEDHFLGYCNSFGSRGYIPMEQPLGPVAG